MSAKVLNWVIFISIIGIGALFVRDSFFKPPKLVTVTIASPTPGTIEPTKDPEVSCSNSYFTFEKGTAWKYHIVTKTKSQTTKNIVKDDVFTSKIIEASPSSLLIESQFAGEKEKITNKIICRQSGLYGFPFPIFKELKSSISLDSFANFNNILLLPNDNKLKKGAEWTSDLGALRTNLISMVEKENGNELFITSRLDSSFSPLQSFMKGAKNVLRYTVAREKGPTEVHIKLNLGTIQNIEMDLKLLEFRKISNSL